MNSRQLAVLALCLVISITSLFLLSVYAGATFLVITATLAMCFCIYNSAGKAMEKPIILILIDEDGKTLVIHNSGDWNAENIRISIVPANIEFTIPSIEGDSIARYETGALMGKNRAIITYNDENGKEYSHRQRLVFREECEYDPTKPMIQLF